MSNGTATLDLTTAAALLKVHPKTLQKLARAGAIPACKIGRVRGVNYPELRSR
jgi:excisionase family DNA binding protein